MNSLLNIATGFWTNDKTVLKKNNYNYCGLGVCMEEENDMDKIIDEDFFVNFEI